MTTVGAYVGNDPKDLDRFETWLGRDVDNLLFYFNQTSWRAFDSSIGWAIDLWKGVEPQKIIWCVPLVVDGSTLQDAAAGAYDSHYRKAATALLASSAGNGAIHVRTGWEFNGTWFPWSAVNQPDAFIAAYRHFVDLFRSVSDRFVFEWNVNQSDGYGQPMDPATAYPGDDYVDVIGMDFYYSPEWDGADPVAAWNAMVTEKYGLQWHQNFAAAHGKATAYSEWGVRSDNAGAYIQKAAEWFDAHQVAYNAYWQTDMASYPGHLGHYPTAAGTFKQAFGTGWASTGPELPPTPDSVVLIDRWLIGDSLNNTLVGGAGRDYLNGEGGVDTLVGHGGNDLYVVDHAQDHVIEPQDGGVDEVQSWANSFVLSAWVESLTLLGSYAQSGQGNAGANVLNAGSGSHTLDGGAANDRLIGGTGNDWLIGGLGADVMIGGAGHDTYFVDDRGDRVSELARGGTDTISTSVNFTLAPGSEVERLNAAGASNISVVGNAFANTITGNAGVNRIFGGLGNDQLKGGAGKDIFVFDTKPNKSSNVDLILDFSTVSDSIWLENRIFTKLGAGSASGIILKPGMLAIGTRAQDVDDRIIYDPKSGALSYDMDGTGSAAAVRIAILPKKLKMTNSDFFVV